MSKVTWTFGALLIAAAATLGFLSMNIPDPSQDEVSQVPEYINEKHGFAFYYSSEYVVDEYSPDLIGISDPNALDIREHAIVTVKKSAELAEASKTLEDFLLRGSEMFCAADGPNGSLRCPKLLSAVPFTSDLGLEGSKFTLELEFTSGTTTKKDVYGPMYAFLYPAQPVGEFAGVFVLPTITYPPQQLPDVAGEIAKKMRFE